MRSLFFAMIGVVAFALPARAELPTDLALVPSNAVVVVHLKISDLWKHDILKGLRDTVAAAGPKALDAYGKQVYPHPELFENATLFLTLNEEDPKREPNVVVIVKFKSRVDGEVFRGLWLPEAKPEKAGERTISVDADKRIATFMADGQYLVIGNLQGVKTFAAKGGAKGDGPLTTALADSATKILTVAVHVKSLPIPENAWREVPPDIVPLLKAERVVLTMDGRGAEPVFELKANYGSDAGAVDAEKGLKAAVNLLKDYLKKPKAEMEEMLFKNADKGPQPPEEMGKKTMALVGLGAINRAEAELDKLPVARKGSDLTVSVTVPKEVVQIVGALSASVAMLLPAVEKVRGAAASSSSMNNMKQMGIAFWNFESAMQKLPPAAICDNNGKPLLSWRVAILPYIEQDNLYNQFKLDEPWDSEHNKKLIPMMPKIYLSPRVTTEAGKTVYKAFVGKEAVLDWKESRRIASITDGTSNTFLVAEAGEAVTWTKPEEIEFDSTKALPKLELPGGLKLINVLFCDGHVRRIDLSKWPEKTLKASIGAADGIVIEDPDNAAEEDSVRFPPPPPLTAAPKPVAAPKP